MSIETLPRGMYPAVLDDVAKHRFTVFTQGDYNFNIIGVRNLDSSSVNRFDDTIYVCWKVGFEWKMFKAPITTDPGRYWLEKPDYKPCAVMYHNQQVRSAYKFGLHRGSYKALVQAKPIKYWRDGNKDAHIDYTGTIYNDIIGLNIHRASTRQDGSQYVDKWSAGCQVFQKNSDFQTFLQLLEKQINGWRHYTYTLISSR